MQLLQTEYLRLIAIDVNGVFVLALRIFALNCNLCEKNICADSEVTIHSESGTYMCRYHSFRSRAALQPQKTETNVSDGEFAVTGNRADGNANAPGSRGDQYASSSGSSGSPRSSSPNDLESPIRRGPLLFFANLDCLPTYVIKSM